MQIFITVKKGEIMTGKDLRYSMVLSNIKPSQLADNLGVSRSMVSKWLSGTCRISKKHENAITQFLGTVEDVEAKDRRRLEQIILSMTKEEKINAILYILGTL